MRKGLRRRGNPVYVGTPDGGRLPITWGSIFWMTVFTTIGTVIGTWVYVKYANLLPANLQPPTTGPGSPAQPLP